MNSQDYDKEKPENYIIYLDMNIYMDMRFVSIYHIEDLNGLKI